jgi:hypothetical protein
MRDRSVAFSDAEKTRSADGWTAFRLTEIAGRHEAQLGTGNGRELAPDNSGFRRGKRLQRSPEAVREQDDRAGVFFVVMTIVVNLFVRLRRSCEHRQKHHQHGRARRGDAAEVFGERGEGEHGGESYERGLCQTRQGVDL